MKKYELNNRNIDAASGEITKFLTDAKVDLNDIHRIRLSVEEIVLKYSDWLGENKTFDLVMSKRLHTLRIELSVSGESFDPFIEDGENSGGILHTLLSNLGFAPVWRYKNGKNIIIFTTKKMPQILQLGIAILAAVVLGGICYLLSRNISAFITGEVITPVFNNFMGLLSAIFGPVIFLSVVWRILGIGDMTTFGKIVQADHGYASCGCCIDNILSFYRVDEKKGKSAWDSEENNAHFCHRSYNRFLGCRLSDQHCML